MPIGTQGLDFLVNTTTDDDQVDATITALPDGRFVVAWKSEGTGGDGDGHGIRARVFNADGTPAGNDFVVNTTTLADQSEPSVVALADGRFVVGWRSDDAGDGNGTCIRARIFNADGTADMLVNSGSDFIVNTTSPSNQLLPAVAALADGRFFVSYSSNGGDGDGNGVLGRVFNADGTADTTFNGGNDFVLSTITAGNQLFTSVATLADGRLVVSWQSGLDLRARIFRADGTPDPSVNGGNDFDLNAAPLNSIPDKAHELTALADGRFVAVWLFNDFMNPPAIYARVFNSDGTADASVNGGNEVSVNTTAMPGGQGVDVIALADGRFLVTWGSQDNGDGSIYCVRARLFNLDGTPAGDDFILNTTTNANQRVPAVTALADGRFVVAWDSADGTDDPSDFGMRGRIFDPKVFIGTVAADTWQGGNLADTISGGDDGDVLAGLGGNDRINGDDGADILNGGDGDDSIFGGQGEDDIYGGTGRDELFGGEGADKLIVAPGDDTAGEVYNGGGGGGLNFLQVGWTGPGAFNYDVDLRDDTLYRVDRLEFLIPGLSGTSSTIRITASQMNGAGTPGYVGAVIGTGSESVAERLIVSMGDTLVFDITGLGRGISGFGNAKDRIEIVGDNDAETITGSDFADILSGNGGNDTFFGGIGNDLLIGGAGRDTQTGGTGSDIFRFTSRTHSPNNGNRDQIIDFDKLGTGDRLDLSSLFGPRMAYIEKAAFTKLGQVRINDVSGNDLIVEANVSGSLAADFSVRLKNTSFASMAANDFIL